MGNWLQSQGEATRQQGNKATRQQGNKATRQIGNSIKIHIRHCASGWHTKERIARIWLAGDNGELVSDIASHEEGLSEDGLRLALLGDSTAVRLTFLKLGFNMRKR